MNEHFATVRQHLLATAVKVGLYDPDLAVDLADLAADYAGPYTEETQ